MLNLTDDIEDTKKSVQNHAYFTGFKADDTNPEIDKYLHIVLVQGSTREQKAKAAKAKMLIDQFLTVRCIILCMGFNRDGSPLMPMYTSMIDVKIAPFTKNDSSDVLKLNSFEKD